MLLAILCYGKENETYFNFVGESSFKIVNECSAECRIRYVIKYFTAPSELLYNSVFGNYYVKVTRSTLDETQRKSHNRPEP